MADFSKPVPQGSRFGRFMREGLDRLVFSNQGYNPRYGTWDRGGMRQGAIQTAVGSVIPGGGTAYGLIANAIHNARNNNARNWQGPTDLVKDGQGYQLPLGQQQQTAQTGLTPPNVQVQGPDLAPIHVSGIAPMFGSPQQHWYTNYMAGLSGPMAGNGGARAAITWNGPGITDPAAIRSFMEASKYQPQYQMTDNYA